MISKKETERIVKLARIKLTGKEVEKMRKDLSSILDYFETLKAVDVSGIEPCFHPTGRFLKDKLRNDVKEPESVETIDKIIKAAPNREKRHIKVKEVF